MACYGMIFIKKKIQILENFFFHFILLNLIFLGYYCSINLKKPSEHSGLCPDTSSFIEIMNSNEQWVLQVKYKTIIRAYLVHYALVTFSFIHILSNGLRGGRGRTLPSPQEIDPLPTQMVHPLYCFEISIFG